MGKAFHILLIWLILLMGVQVILSCSSDLEKDFDIIGIAISSSSEEGVSVSSSGSGIGSSDSGSGSSMGSSSDSEGVSSDSSGESSDSGDEGSSSSISVSSSSGPPPLPPGPDGLTASGYYQTGLSVTIPPETAQGIIRCETNGEAPKASSTIKSDDVVNFLTASSSSTEAAAKILRCAYFKDNVLSSGLISRTYLTGRLPNLPIVSINVDPDSMFNRSGFALYKSGTGPANCGGGPQDFYTEQEIPIHVEFFEKNAAHKWSYPAGIKIHGGCSRQYPKKSVIVSFRESYGQKSIDYPLFPDFPSLRNFKHFMLRNNGNNFQNDFIRDMLMQSLTEGMGLDYQKGRAVIVYYNGRYFGIHNLRERTNSDYFETNYGINSKYIDLVDVENDEPSEGSNAEYQRVINWLEGVSLANDMNFERLKEDIDVDNFTNHFQSRIYYRDGDWPGKNMKRWRQNNKPGAKWKWLLYDTDHGFGSWGTNEVGKYSTALHFATATNGPSWPNPPKATFMLRKLLENEGYKRAFINRFSVLIATYFESTRVLARIETLIEPTKATSTGDSKEERDYDKDRWPRDFYLDNNTIRDFASSRPDLMHSEIRSFFGLSTSVNLTLNVSGNGNILVHDLPLPSFSSKPLTIKAYTGVPIELKAEGAGFKGWKVNGASDGNTNPRTFNLSANTTIEAEF
jgi:hypothetical protein